MLSFLREQGLESSTSQKRTASAGRGDREAPENAQGQEYLTVAARSKNVRKSTIMVAVLFCVGLVGLWFMIKKSQPQAALAAPAESEETQIEGAITRLTGVSTEMFSRMDQIVQKFYEFSDVLQVGVSDLVKNPFELEMFLSNLMGKLDPKEAEIEVDPEKIRQQQIRQKANDLKLASIMKSEQGKCCMINSRVFYEGDLINGFKIVQIGDTSVKIEWHGEDNTRTSPLQTVEIVLKLSE